MLSKTSRLGAIILLVCLLSLSVVALVKTTVMPTQRVVYAAPLSQTAYTPTISILSPQVGEVITQTDMPYIVEIEVTPNCGINGSNCLPSDSSLQIQVVSLTIRSLESGQTIVNTATHSSSISQSQIITYGWILPTANNQQFVLTATALNSQTDPVMGLSKPVTVTIDTQYILSVTIVGTGTVTKNPDANIYPAGQIVTLKAITETKRWWFDGWSGDLPHGSAHLSSSTLVLTMTSDKAIRATFRTTTTLFLPLVLKNYPPPPPMWAKGNGTSDQFRSPYFCDNNIWYAGTHDNGVWKSTDNAQGWNKITDFTSFPYPVVANSMQCNQAFFSVWGQGVYKLEDTQTENVNANLGETYLYGLAITGTTLYAGTDSQGIYKTDINNINWQAINSGITETRIRSLAIQGNKIYAGARNCKLYISDNQGVSWSEETVLSSGCDDAQVWSVVQIGDILYAGLGGNKGLYHKGKSGTLVNWQPVSGIPSNTIYGLAYDQANNILYVSAYGSGIYRCNLTDGVAQMCSPYNSGLSTLDTRELDIGNGILAAGSEDGLWHLPLFK